MFSLIYFIQLKKAVERITLADYQKLDSYLIHSLRQKGLNVNEAAKQIREVR